jgi:predicted transposase/invertase (TIGR01784 family)
LFDAAKVARFTPIERQAYEDSLKYYRDLKNVTDTARDEGRLEGFEEGIEKGLQTAALAMYKNGLAVDFIAQTLNINLEDVKSWVSTEPK